MKKHLTKFNNEEGYNSAYSSLDFPNVSYITDTDTVHYNKECKIPIPTDRLYTYLLLKDDKYYLCDSAKDIVFDLDSTNKCFLGAGVGLVCKNNELVKDGALPMLYCVNYEINVLCGTEFYTLWTDAEWTGWLDSGKPDFSKNGGEVESIGDACGSEVPIMCAVRAAKHPGILGQRIHGGGLAVDIFPDTESEIPYATKELPTLSNIITPLNNYDVLYSRNFYTILNPGTNYADDFEQTNEYIRWRNEKFYEYSTVPKTIRIRYLDEKTSSSGNVSYMPAGKVVINNPRIERRDGYFYLYNIANPIGYIEMWF